jgi:hypothetical protein
MNLSIKNFNKPSNKKFKLVADFLLYTLPLYMGAIMILSISDEAKMWLNFGISILTVTIKGITKLTAEIPEEDALIQT